MLVKKKTSKGPKNIPLEKRTARQLVKTADSWWSKYVRLRDSVKQIDGSFVGYCIDGCGKKIVVYQIEEGVGRWKKSGDCGHFISRGIFSLRWDEYNTHLQSSYCNAWRDKVAMITGYAEMLDARYGYGTADNLQKQAKQPGAYALPPKATLLQLIKDCKQYVKDTLGE